MKTKRIFILAAVLASLCIIAVFIINTRLRLIDYSAPSYNETTEKFDNPYTGWYQIYAFRLSGSEDLDLSYIQKQEYGPELLLLEVDLRNFRSGPLDEHALNQLNSLLSACRLKGKQIILRFVYDTMGNSVVYEPDDISVILGHMTQTAEVINRYTDCVYIMQGLYIGAWGEMHSSEYSNSEDLRTLANHLNSVIDPSVFFAVRTPAQWRAVTGLDSPLTTENAYNGTLISRIGLFNDGMTGSYTDLGTYAEEDTERSAPGIVKLSRSAEVAFQNQLCNYVPNGGEAVIDNSYNDLTEAAGYLSEIRVSYLNSDYDKAVLNKWKETVFNAQDAYDGFTGYDYIGNHLGYRYFVSSSEIDYPSPFSDTADLKINIKNDGFSPAYRKFDVTFVLKNSDTDEEYHFPIETDTRTWLPGDTVSIDIPIYVRDYDAGEYSLYIYINDPKTGFYIYLANDSAQSALGVPLGSISIRKFADF